MRKIWTIAWKDVSTTFRDRNLVLVMLAAPLAVATVIALAFGGTGEDVVIKDIPVAIVNLDKGANGQNLGDIYVNTFIPAADGSGNNFRRDLCAGKWWKHINGQRQLAVVGQGGQVG